MTRAHIMFVTYLSFKEGVSRMKTKDLKIKENLNNLVRLFALNELMQDSASCYEAGYFKANSAVFIMEAVKHLLVVLRP